MTCGRQTARPIDVAAEKDVSITEMQNIEDLRAMLCFNLIQAYFKIACVVMTGPKYWLLKSINMGYRMYCREQ